MKSLVAAVERLDPLTVSGRVAAVNGLLIEARGGLTRLAVGARAEIFRIMVGLAKAGKSIIMVSSDMPELISMSDRIGVMREGRLTHVLPRREVTEEALMKNFIGL